jgi:putative inorganic carbon (hco3(-)) transporter
MLFLIALVAIDAAIVVAAVVLRNPKILIPAVVIGLPVEYFGTETVGVLGEGGIGGAVRALLNPGKFAMLLTIVLVVLRHRHEPRRIFPDSAILLPIVALTALTVLGVFWSDSLIPPNSVAIMPMYVAFVFAAPALVEDRKDAERIIGAFLFMAAALGALAVAQRLFGVFNWREILIQSDETSYRSNATFADPNLLARYLSISLALGVGMILALGPRRSTVWLALPALGAGALAIVATASRSGWLMLILCTFLMVLWAPISRQTKTKIIGTAAMAMLVLVTIIMLQGGPNAERIRSITQPELVLGLREFLIKAGWAMFKDNPIHGVGSGNFEHALVLNYIQILPEWARTTLSHTSLVSIMAEQGILGISMFLFVSLRVAITLVRSYRRAANVYARLMVGWLGTALIGIVLQSQSEGRLLDEPYIWLLLSLLVVFETRPAFARLRDTAVPEPANAQGLPTFASPGAPLPAVAIVAEPSPGL